MKGKLYVWKKLATSFSVQFYLNSDVELEECYNFFNINVLLFSWTRWEGQPLTKTRTILIDYSPDSRETQKKLEMPHATLYNL